MSPASILSDLERLATRVGIRVRTEPFDKRVLEGKGGLCWVRGKPVLLMDADLPPVDKIVLLADALAAFGVTVLHLPPVLRARLRSRSSHPLPVRGAKGLVKGELRIALHAADDRQASAE